MHATHYAHYETTMNGRRIGTGVLVFEAETLGTAAQRAIELLRFWQKLPVPSLRTEVVSSIFDYRLIEVVGES